jgi:hypothetical protein
MCFERRERHEHQQSPILVSSKALRIGLGAASCVAGMGVSILLDINCSFRCTASHTGQQADTMGFHYRNGRPLGCRLLLER